MKLTEFTDREALSEKLADIIAEIISDKLKQQNSCEIIIPGGTSPQIFFSKLNQKSLPWEKINFILSDERWVEKTSPHSNENMVKKFLPGGIISGLKTEHKKPYEAKYELEKKYQKIKPAAAVLGFGEDFHVASLFPEDMPDYNAKIVASERSDFSRISLGYSTLASAEKIFFIAFSQKKLEVLKKSATEKQNLPLNWFIKKDNVEIFWAP